ncbi:unnamed protein product [Moneuplotes crassus]|uniref:Uncharacterized protein n=2 Tax=Euplotes crassus TaxID=5936 RepID=A0AAD2DAP4_EUPCR|nr:unnamed protein product [Moneuplotes crassus]
MIASSNESDSGKGSRLGVHFNFKRNFTEEPNSVKITGIDSLMMQKVRTSAVKDEDKARVNIKEMMDDFHNKSSDLIDSIKGTLMNLESQKEKEVVRVYKEHMENIEKELCKVKKQEDEKKAKKQAQFKDLVDEIEWYKNESNKLTETYELQKREIQMLKSKKRNIVEYNNKILKEQTKGLKRQHHILEHVMTKNKKTLKELKAMNPAQLRQELVTNPHYNQMFIELTKINEKEYGEFLAQKIDKKEDIQGDQKEAQTEESKDYLLKGSSTNILNKREESPIREIEYKNQKANITDSYQKSQDYVSYGYEYVGVEKDPQKVDRNLPINDYVYQLLCNPNCTDEIFKEKMIEYQFHKDKSIDNQIKRLRKQIEIASSNNTIRKMRYKQSDAVLYKIELQNFLLDCVKECKKFLPRGPEVNDTEEIKHQKWAEYTKRQMSVQKKRNIQTAIPGKRGRNLSRPIHSKKLDKDKPFESYKANASNRILDSLTQKFVSNEDLLAEFITKITLIPNMHEKEISLSQKDITGVDVSNDDGILNIEKSTKDPNLTHISYKTNEEDINNASLDLINMSMAKRNLNRSKYVVLRKESEDSFLRMCNPKSNYGLNNSSTNKDTRIDSSYTTAPNKVNYTNFRMIRKVNNNKEIMKRRPFTTQSLKRKHKRNAINKSIGAKDTSFYGSTTTAQVGRIN